MKLFCAVEAGEEDLVQGKALTGDLVHVYVVGRENTDAAPVRQVDEDVKRTPADRRHMVLDLNSTPVLFQLDAEGRRSRLGLFL
jgi:hypothetical protein